MVPFLHGIIDAIHLKRWYSYLIQNKFIQSSGVSLAVKDDELTTPVDVTGGRARAVVASETGLFCARLRPHKATSFEWANRSELYCY